MENSRTILNQRLINAFLVVGAIVGPVTTFNCSGKLMSASAATTQIPQSQSIQAQSTEPQHSGVTVDLTSVVVAALTLGFGYGVLKTFQGGSK